MWSRVFVCCCVFIWVEYKVDAGFLKGFYSSGCGCVNRRSNSVVNPSGPGLHSAGRFFFKSTASVSLFIADLVNYWSHLHLNLRVGDIEKFMFLLGFNCGHFNLGYVVCFAVLFTAAILVSLLFFPIASYIWPSSSSVWGFPSSLHCRVDLVVRSFFSLFIMESCSFSFSYDI